MSKSWLTMLHFSISHNLLRKWSLKDMFQHGSNRHPSQKGLLLIAPPGPDIRLEKGICGHILCLDESLQMQCRFGGVGGVGCCPKRPIRVFQCILWIVNTANSVYSAWSIVPTRFNVFILYIYAYIYITLHDMTWHYVTYIRTTPPRNIDVGRLLSPQKMVILRVYVGWGW